jgi:hypothetical protein
MTSSRTRAWPTTPLSFPKKRHIEENIVQKPAIRSLFGFSLAIGLAVGLIPAIKQSASCADCESDNLPGIKKAFQTFSEQCAKQLAGETGQRNVCFASNTYNKILPIMKALGKDNRFGPSGRILLVGETQNGTLAAGANRGYQIAAPVDKDSVTVKFAKTDGGSGVLVKICSVSEDGSMKRVGTISFDQNNESGEKVAALSGVRGKIIRIDVAGFGGVGKKFQYRLTTG